MNILDAIADPKVFAPLFRDQSTWAAWRAFLAALFALPMSDEQLATYRECTGRTDPPTSPSTEAWLIIGRRGGKSFTLALVACFLASFRDWRPYLAVGERGTVMILASDRRQARVIMRFIKGILGAVPMLAATIEATRAEAIDLTTSISIEVHTASFSSVRGYTCVACLCDEIAFWTTDETSSSPDFEILNALRPTMATVPGSMLLCASSPYARRGALWDAHHKYFGNANGPLIWQAPTRTMNPSITQAFIDAEFEKDPISAAAEYGAQFRTDIEGFITRDALAAVTDRSVLERGPIGGLHYTAFVDPSGGSADSFTLAIAHKQDDIAILDCIREIRPPFSPEAVITEFADLLKTYRIAKVQGDRYAGEFPRELFSRQGIKYELSDDPKSSIYLNFLPLINSGRVRLLGNQRLVAQLTNLERRTARSGKDSIDHAPGGHDDVVNAVAGALLSATAKKPNMRFGAIGVDGRIFWHDEEPVRQRLRIVTISEKEDLRRRGLL